MSRSVLPIAACMAIAAIATIMIADSKPAHAQNAGDGQFLSTYKGPTTANDLLVDASTVTFDGTNFVFTSTLDANVGTTVGGYYVWGVNRGAGTAGFASLGASKDESGVLFDAIIAAHPVADSITTSPGLSVTRLAGGGSTTLPLSDMSFSGKTLTLTIPLTALASTGFTPTNYNVNLWPRFEGTFNGSSVTGNAQISQFAPNDTTFKVNGIGAAAPEPASLPLLIGPVATIASCGVVRKRRWSRAQRG